MHACECACACACWGISPPVQLVCDNDAMATEESIAAKMSVSRLEDMTFLLSTSFILDSLYLCSSVYFCLYNNLLIWDLQFCPICRSVCSSVSEWSIFLFIHLFIDPPPIVLSILFYPNCCVSICCIIAVHCCEWLSALVSYLKYEHPRTSGGRDANGRERKKETY